MKKSIHERLKQRRPILLDGATGTELDRRGVDISLPLWSTGAIETAPDVLEQIHAEYVAAGAEIITANTFRAHARNLSAEAMSGRAAELTRRAVEIARAAAGDSAWVAGSQAPLEDCYSPHRVPDDDSLKSEHREMARNLAQAGVDLILVETQNTIREALAATESATLTGLPVFVSFVCGVDGKLLSGERLSDAARAAMSFKPAALLVNCVPAESVLSMLEEIHADAPDTLYGAYANIGRQNPDGTWGVTGAEDPQHYARYAQTWLESGTMIIGGCCGTTPDFVAKIKRIIA